MKRTAKLEANHLFSIVDGNAAQDAMPLLCEVGRNGRLPGLGRAFYRMEKGRLIAPIGLLSRLQRGLASNGWNIEIEGDPAASFYEGRTAPVSAPVSASDQRGVSPRRGLVLNPVSEGNCVLARGGGEQLDENDQSVG